MTASEGGKADQKYKVTSERGKAGNKEPLEIKLQIMEYAKKENKKLNDTTETGFSLKSADKISIN